MFRKKECQMCGRKINNKHRFCPYCGNIVSEKNEDWGMLGKDDFIESFNEIKFPAGFNMIFNSLIKNFEKQFKNIDKEIEKPDKRINKGGISISISTSGNTPPKIMVKSFGDNPKFKQKEQEIKKQIKEVLPSFSKENLKKISQLPKKEPKTNLRRLSDKVIYEIEMPGVESIKDVSIIRLENSIEIKAIAKDKVYLKLIPINLPVISYNLGGGKLILELEAGD